MSLIRTAFVLGAVIMLLPTDEHRQAEVAGVANAAVERTVTFCERNPSTCAAGSEIWATFLRKAEFGVGLVSKLVREQMSRPASAPSQAAWQTQSTSLPNAAAGGQPGHIRLEPPRGTLTGNDAAPQWRGYATGAQR